MINTTVNLTGGNDPNQMPSAQSAKARAMAAIMTDQDYKPLEKLTLPPPALHANEMSPELMKMITEQDKDGFKAIANLKKLFGGGTDKGATSTSDTSANQINSDGMIDGSEVPSS